MNRLLVRLTGLYLGMLIASVLTVVIALGLFTYTNISTVRMQQIHSDASHIARLMERRCTALEAQGKAVYMDSLLTLYAEVMAAQYNFLVCDSSGRVLAHYTESHFAQIDSVPNKLSDKFVVVYPLLAWLWPHHSSNALVLSDSSAAPFQSAAFHSRRQRFWVVVIPRYLLAIELVQRLGALSVGVGIAIFVAMAAVFGWILYRMVAGRLQALNAVVVELENGNLAARVVVPVVGIADDIDLLGLRVNRIADVMQGFVERFRRQDESRRKLLADISHELRTPMMIAQGCMETILLHNGSMPEEKRYGYVQAALREIGNLDRLVQQLFDLSALEVAREQAMQWESVPYDEFLYSVVMQHQVLAEQSGKSLVLTMPGSLPDLRIDPRRMISVVNNLLANAFRHTHTGGRIEVDARYDVENQLVYTSISDDGEGIGAEHLARIFEAFYREIPPGSHRKDRSGAGLGLMLCRQIVELHGGTISVESTQGVRTVFVFSLPVVPFDDNVLLPDLPE